MTPGDQGRPSMPHAQHRVPTAPRPLPRRDTQPDEAPTVREQVDPELAELLAILRDPSGLSVESVLKLLNVGTKRAVIATRQDDRLRVGLDEGKLSERLDSIVGTMVGKRRRREVISLVGFVAGAIASAVMGVWLAVAPRAREAAEVAVIAPALEAKRVAEVAAVRTDTHAARLDAIEASQSELAASVEKLNGAVVMLLARLPEPPPTRIEVPATIEKRGRR